MIRIHAPLGILLTVGFKAWSQVRYSLHCVYAIMTILVLIVTVVKRQLNSVIEYDV